MFPTKPNSSENQSAFCVSTSTPMTDTRPISGSGMDRSNVPESCGGCTSSIISISLTALDAANTLGASNPTTVVISNAEFIIVFIFFIFLFCFLFVI